MGDFKVDKTGIVHASFEKSIIPMRITLKCIGMQLNFRNKSHLLEGLLLSIHGVNYPDESKLQST